MEEKNQLKINFWRCKLQTIHVKTGQEHGDM
jgi:hypothetical protein